MDLSNYKSKDLRAWRLLLASQSAPKINTAPVTDIGSGISQGVNTIINSLTHQHEQAQLNALLKDQADAEALKNKNTDAVLKNLTGVDNLSGTDASIINKLIDQHREDTNRQGLKDSLTGLKDSSGLPLFTSDAVNAISQDKDASSSLLKTFGGQELGTARAFGAEDLLGSLKDRQPTPIEQAYLNSVGINAPTYFQRLKEGADVRSAISDSVMKGAQAKMAPVKAANEVTQQNQQITANNQNNQLGANRVTRDNALLQEQQNFLNSGNDQNGTAAKSLSLVSAGLSNNPHSALSSLLPSKAALFNNVGDLTIPDANQAQGGGFKTNFPTLKLQGPNPFDSNVQATPAQRAGMIQQSLGTNANALLQGAGSALNQAGQSIKYGLDTGANLFGYKDAGDALGQSLLQAGKNLNPFLPYGQ